MILDKLSMKYNKWDELNLISDGIYSCKCKCGIEEIHTEDDIRYDKIRMCKACISKDPVERQRKKYEGMQFGKWRIENFIGNRRYICLCTGCNTRYEIVPADIARRKPKYGKEKSCRKCSGIELKDIKGHRFGDYLALEYIGNHYWKCECTRCGKIKNVTSQHLTLNNPTKCIDCSNKEKGQEVLNNTIKSLIGKQINNLKIIGYNYENNKYICECQCKNRTIIEVHRSNLKQGNTKSCGCLTKALKNNTMLDRYGDIASKRINNPRNLYDIQSLEDKETFLNRYEELSNKIGRIPCSFDVANEFDITTPIALKYAHKYNVNINTDTRAWSEYERQIQDIFDKVDIEIHSRNIIYPQELDIYIPSYKIAIEFNGSYWHSTKYTNKYYHQQKTIKCAKQGIRLIHIFEHEWHDKIKRIQLENMLININNDNRQLLNIEQLEVKSVNINDCIAFLNKNHLYGYKHSDIMIGLYNKNSLVSVMTFEKQSINSSFEYELTRFCTDHNYKIQDAANKLFINFIDTYKPKSIVTYCDISKFTGNTYTKLGFVCNVNSITEPNYCWVNSKLDVIEKDIEQEMQADYKIMDNLGYYKIFDSGNLKLTWLNN